MQAATATTPLAEGRALSDPLAWHAQALKAGMRPLELFDALPMFKPAASWKAWRAFIAAVFNEPMDAEELAIFRECTGREQPPTEPVTDIYMPVGRRGGKSRVVGFLAWFLATFVDYEPFLAPGELAGIPVLAADKDEAHTILGYVLALFDLPMFAGLLAKKPAHGRISLRNHVEIVVRTASFRANRGYTVAAALCDEIAFWRTAKDSANPDFRIIEALEPSMATIPNAMRFYLSSPYAQAGVLYEGFERYFGKDVPGVLVWKAPTTRMNPSPQVAKVVADAYRKDGTSADGEYGANFREDVLAYISRRTIKACTVVGRKALPPRRLEVVDGQAAPEPVVYFAFVDTSGGSQDSMTLSIAHWEGPRGDVNGGRAVQDVIKEWKAPFNTGRVVKKAAAIIKGYGLSSVEGDKYAGEWPRDRFAEEGISFVHTERPKSAIYQDVLPAFNSLQVELLDHSGTADQFTSLLRRTTPGGKDVIDHPPKGHDDLANSSAGALLLAYAVGMWSSAKVPKAEPKSTTELMEAQWREAEREASLRQPDMSEAEGWASQWEP